MATAVDRAKQVTMTELNAIIGVSDCIPSTRLYNINSYTVAFLVVLHDLHVEVYDLPAYSLYLFFNHNYYALKILI